MQSAYLLRTCSGIESRGFGRSQQLESAARKAPPGSVAYVPQDQSRSTTRVGERSENDPRGPKAKRLGISRCFGWPRRRAAGGPPRPWAPKPPARSRAACRAAVGTLRPSRAGARRAATALRGQGSAWIRPRPPPSSAHSENRREVPARASVATLRLPAPHVCPPERGRGRRPTAARAAARPGPARAARPATRPASCSARRRSDSSAWRWAAAADAALGGRDGSTCSHSHRSHDSGRSGARLRPITGPCSATAAFRSPADHP